jgi:hypothetical protein
MLLLLPPPPPLPLPLSLSLMLSLPLRVWCSAALRSVAGGRDRGRIPVP